MSRPLRNCPSCNSFQKFVLKDRPLEDNKSVEIYVVCHVCGLQMTVSRHGLEEWYDMQKNKRRSRRIRLNNLRRAKLRP